MADLTTSHATIDHTGITGAGTPQALDTTDSPQFAGINLGHASDTTLARVSAGVVSIEGTNIVTAGAATGSGLTMNTARLLGRTTASSGAIEEMTVGSGLSLTGGSLAATGGVGAGALLGLTAYRPGSDTSVGTNTSSSTSADVDATNAIVTFTAPASTNVLVRFTCYGVNNTASKSDYWQVRESTTVLADELVSSNETNGKRFTAVCLITGISGGSHTYKWGYRTSGGVYTLYGGPTFGSAVMEVWAAP